MATRNHTERLATPQIFRESIRVRTADQLTSRLRESDRIERFLALFADAKPKPEWFYEFTRGEQRRRHPAFLEHEMIRDGIRAGQITKDALIAYRAAQLQDDLASFADGTDPDAALYVAFMQEAAEAVEANTLYRGMPTPENCALAIRETADIASVATLRAAALKAGRAS